MIERVQILFATGTGNSYKVACWAEDFLKIKGIPVRVDPLHAFAKDLSPAFAPGTLLGISVPTHGFTAQWSVLKKVAALPRGNGSLAYVTACCAGMKVGPLHVPGLEASAGWLIAWMLFLKNFKVRAVNGVDMPSNWLVVHPGFSEKSAAFMAARCRNKLILLLQRVVEGKTHFPYRAWINLVMGIVLFPVSLGYNLVGRLVLAKMLFADARCTSCGQCARMCPVQAITMRGTRKPFPRWSFKCESCMRCVGFCPTQAIEMNSLWFAAAFWFLFWGLEKPTGGILQQLAISGGSGLYLVTAVSLQLILVLAASWLAGELLFWLARVPGIRTMLMDTSLSRFFRRYRAPGVSPQDLQCQGRSPAPQMRQE